MKIINESLLQVFREKTRCEHCRKQCRQGCDPAHIFSRGAGRVDIHENLVSLCRSCHTSSHAGGSPTKAEMLAIAAKREKTTAEKIIDLVNSIRRDDSRKVWIFDGSHQ